MKKQRVKSVYASVLHKLIVKLVKIESVKQNQSIYKNNEDGN